MKHIINKMNKITILQYYMKQTIHLVNFFIII